MFVIKLYAHKMESNHHVHINAEMCLCTFLNIELLRCYVLNNVFISMPFFVNKTVFLFLLLFLLCWRHLTENFIEAAQKVGKHQTRLFYFCKNSLIFFTFLFLAFSNWFLLVSEYLVPKFIVLLHSTTVCNLSSITKRQTCD